MSDSEALTLMAATILCRLQRNQHQQQEQAQQ